MRAMRLGRPASAATLMSVGEVARFPAAGEIKVRIRAASLNFRDSLVVNGVLPAPEGIVPVSDGAGEVVQIGEG